MNSGDGPSKPESNLRVVPLAFQAHQNLYGGHSHRSDIYSRFFLKGANVNFRFMFRQTRNRGEAFHPCGLSEAYRLFSFPVPLVRLNRNR